MALFALALSGLVVTTAPQGAVNYGRVPRTLVREPAYQTKSPRYALLLFGAEARLRVWAVIDGTVLYLDRNGDGDLTQQGECFLGHLNSPEPRQDIRIRSRD